LAELVARAGGAVVRGAAQMSRQGAQVVGHELEGKLVGGEQAAFLLCCLFTLVPCRGLVILPSCISATAAAAAAAVLAVAVVACSSLRGALSCLLL